MRFVFLNANRNSQRKRLDQMIMGFVKLLTITKDPVHLLVVTAMNPQHGAFYDLQRIYITELKRVGLVPEALANRLMVADTAPPNTLTDAQINEIYNMSDIGPTLRWRGVWSVSAGAPVYGRPAGGDGCGQLSVVSDGGRGGVRSAVGHAVFCRVHASWILCTRL
jgi:hypothetical protein